MPDDISHECGLTAPQLLQRLAEWSELASHSIDRRVESDRIVSTYPADPKISRRLKQLIAAEGQCCSFMTFDVREGPHQVVVELRVAGETGPQIAQMLGLTASG